MRALFLFLFFNLILFFTTLAIAKEPDYSKKFQQYSITNIYEGSIAEIDFSSDPKSRKFQTRLKDGIKQGPNYSGSFRLVEWGCGTNCTQIAIVNVKTGKICDWVGTCGSSKYRLDSNLLVINPGATEQSESYPPGCITEFYILKNSTLYKLK